MSASSERGVIAASVVAIALLSPGLADFAPKARPTVFSLLNPFPPLP